jgi:hypothetical protein
MLIKDLVIAVQEATFLCFLLCILKSQDPTSGLQQLLKALPDGAAPKATFVKGDRVVVVSGDLNTLEGDVRRRCEMCYVGSCWLLRCCCLASGCGGCQEPEHSGSPDICDWQSTSHMFDCCCCALLAKWAGAGFSAGTLLGGWMLTGHDVLGHLGNLETAKFLSQKAAWRRWVGDESQAASAVAVTFLISGIPCCCVCVMFR